MPEEGVKLQSHSSILTFDEIVSFVEVAVKMGVDKVRITGGEPLVRKGIVDLVAMISSIDGIKDLSMTTNATCLRKYAFELADAGLQRVNISMDTIDPEKYRWITRGGDITEMLDGINAAFEAGLKPVKLNCVIRDNHNEPDARAVTEYGKTIGAEVRYIKEMDLSSGQFSIVEGGSGGNCAICNRIRLTATGKVKPCLFNDMEFDVRELGNEEAIRQAVDKKPVRGSFNKTGNFYNLGG